MISVYSRVLGNLPTPTPTSSSTPTNTPTQTLTPTNTTTQTPTLTETPTPTPTLTSSQTPTPTPTLSSTQTPTPTLTPTITPTPSPEMPPSMVIVGGTGSQVLYQNSGNNYFTNSSSADSLITSPYARSVSTNGLIYVVGSNTNSLNKLIYSTNGSSWSSSSSANTIFTEGLVAGITYSNGIFMAVGIGGGSGKIAKSTDGISWTGVTGNIPLSSGLFCVAGNNSGTWVVGGGSSISNLYVSTDNGVTFSAVTKDNSFLSSVTNSIVYGGDRFVAVGGQGGKQIAVSYDGITWTGSTNDNVIFDNNIYGIDYNGVYFVAVGAGTNKVAYSTDGFNWSTSTGANSILVSTAFTVHWNGDKWYVGAFDNSGISPGKWLITSTDLITWTVYNDYNLEYLGTAVRAIASI